jgi:hypothetical protein
MQASSCQFVKWYIGIESINALFSRQVEEADLRIEDFVEVRPTWSSGKTKVGCGGVQAGKGRGGVLACTIDASTSTCTCTSGAAATTTSTIATVAASVRSTVTGG